MRRLISERLTNLPRASKQVGELLGFTEGLFQLWKKNNYQMQTQLIYSVICSKMFSEHLLSAREL